MIIHKTLAKKLAVQLSLQASTVDAFGYASSSKQENNQVII